MLAFSRLVVCVQQQVCVSVCILFTRGGRQNAGLKPMLWSSCWKVETWSGNGCGLKQTGPLDEAVSGLWDPRLCQEDQQALM